MSKFCIQIVNWLVIEKKIFIRIYDEWNILFWWLYSSSLKKCFSTYDKNKSLSSMVTTINSQRNSWIDQITRNKDCWKDYCKIFIKIQNFYIKLFINIYACFPVVIKWFFPVCFFTTFLWFNMFNQLIQYHITMIILIHFCEEVWLLHRRKWYSDCN